MRARHRLRPDPPGGRLGSRIAHDSGPSSVRIDCAPASVRSAVLRCGPDECVRSWSGRDRHGRSRNPAIGDGPGPDRSGPSRRFSRRSPRACRLRPDWEGCLDASRSHAAVIELLDHDGLGGVAIDTTELAVDRRTHGWPVRGDDCRVVRHWPSRHGADSERNRGGILRALSPASFWSFEPPRLFKGSIFCDRAAGVRRPCPKTPDEHPDARACGGLGRGTRPGIRDANRRGGVSSVDRRHAAPVHARFDDPVLARPRGWRAGVSGGVPLNRVAGHRRARRREYVALGHTRLQSRVRFGTRRAARTLSPQLFLQRRRCGDHRHGFRAADRAHGRRHGREFAKLRRVQPRLPFDARQGVSCGCARTHVGGRAHDRQPSILGCGASLVGIWTAHGSASRGGGLGVGPAEAVAGLVERRRIHLPDNGHRRHCGIGRAPGGVYLCCILLSRWIFSDPVSATTRVPPGAPDALDTVVRAGPGIRSGSNGV